MAHQRFPLICVCLLQPAICLFSHIQAQAQQRTVPPTVPALQKPVHVPRVATLPDGAQITLRLAAAVKIKEVKVGDEAAFVLYHDLYYKDVLLAKAGEPVHAGVVEADKARWGSRGSKLAIEISGLKLLNGQTLPLRGYSSRAGGIGNAPRIAEWAIKTGSDVVCPMCSDLFAPAALAFFLAPGSNADAKQDTSSSAYVDGNFAIDLASFQPFQRKVFSARGTVQVVRGHYGWPYKRDLYCNGVPLAHLDADHRINLTLDRGYYRFSINPKKAPIQIYVASGTNTNLITTHDAIGEMNEKDINLNTRDVFPKPFAELKSSSDLLERAKPIGQQDVYSTSCAPLSEVYDPSVPKE